MMSAQLEVGNGSQRGEDMSSVKELELMHAEWQQWQEVCKLLRQAGAVTQADLDRPVGRDKWTIKKQTNN